MQGACAAVEASAIRPHEPEAQAEPDDGEDSSEVEDDKGEVDVFSVPVPAAWLTLAFTLSASGGLAWLVPVVERSFLFWPCAYLVLNIAYSFFLKKTKEVTSRLHTISLYLAQVPIPPSPARSDGVPS